MKKKAIAFSCMLILPQIAAAPFASAEVRTMDYSAGVVAAEAIKEKPQQNDAEVTAKISKDKAIEIAKDFVKVPNDYTQQSVMYQGNWYPGNRTIWNINWNRQTEQGFGNISVTVDAENGTVLSMYRWEDTYGKPATYPPKYNWESAKKIAEQFLQEKVPQKASLVKLDTTNLANQRPPLQGDASYYYSFLRVENDIPFQEQYISVTVNGNGEVASYDYRWDDNINIPATSGMISQKEAEKKIKDGMQIQLKYQTIYNYFLPQSEQKPTVKLAYDSRFNYPFIDAKTGQWLDYSGKPIDMKTLPVKLEPLSTEKPSQTTSVNKDITQEQAVEIAKKQFNIPANAVLENVFFNDADQYQKFPVWSLSWRLGEQPMTYISVSIDGHTGQITNYYKEDPSRYQPYVENQTIKQVVNYEQALEKAKEALKTFAPNQLGELTFDPVRNPKPENPGKMREFYFTFHRLVDGIIVEDQFVNITIGTETGEIYQYYQTWDPQSNFPSASNVVSVEKGREVYLDNFTIVPKYLYIENIDYNMPRPTSSKPEVKLVYHFAMKPQNQAVYLDATKGKWVLIETGEPIRGNIEAKDIKGHANEQALQLLIDYNAIDVDDAGLVKPDEEITRGEMVKMLMLVTNPDPYYYKMNYMGGARAATFKDVASNSPYFAYVESAVQQGFIDKTQGEFKPNEAVTREELAEMITKAMRLDKLAQVPDLFNVNFLDADKINKKGTAAIVHHLGIMPAANSNFEPAKKVTRGAGAQAFYQFLQERGKYNR
ncbi:MAG TPA: S-layer homology domain-containing protein [Bacillus bacterium]|nr:S-layer homology domain-containing protein [Bacillus sp. (in: firmicutes)]